MGLLTWISRLIVGPLRRGKELDLRGKRRQELDVSGLLSGLSAPSPPRRRAGASVDLEGPGDYLVQVVGTSFHQREIGSIAGRKTPEGFDLDVVATLALEHDNPKDKKAVRVDVRGVPVGHLSRDDARAYRLMLARYGSPAHPLAVRAKVVGGWDRGRGDEGHFGMRVDLPSWDE